MANSYKKKPEQLNLTYQGITMNVNQWSIYAGMFRSTLRCRIKNWKLDDIFKGTRIEGKKLDPEKVKSTIEKIVTERKNNKRPNCKICGVPVENYTNNNQLYCSYTEEQQEEFNSKLSPCQQKARKRVLGGWKFRLYNGIGPKNIDSVENYKAVQPLYKPVDAKLRSCIGILTNDDQLGPHTFISSGPHHRICDKCHAAAQTRAIYDRPIAKVVFGNQ